VSSTKNRVMIDEVKVTIVFNGHSVYEASTCPARRVSPWIQSFEEITKDGALQIIADDPSQDGKVIKKWLTPNQIGQAFGKCVELGLTHCGSYRVEDLENADACTSDLVLQMAVYDEIVWG